LIGFFGRRYFNGSICREDQGGAEDAEMGNFVLQFLVKILLYPFNFSFLFKQNRKMYGKSERLDYGHERLERKR
jgi:hypothetical protein